MREVSLTLIQTFFLVARDGSYSAAARRLNMSYQSAANHVRRLEQLLGERLVLSEQGAKSIELTARGRSLYKLLEPELDTMLTRLGRILEKERPVLRVGLPQAIFFYLFPPVLRAFQEIHPGIEVLAYERDTVLAELIKDGGLDVCVSERYFGDQAVPQHLIGTYRLALICPRDWGPLPDSADVPRWAADRPFVTYEPGQMLRNLALDFLSQGGHEPYIAVSTSGSSSVKRCVEAGLGFAIIPSWCRGDGDRHLASMDLPALPEIPIYFGEAQFLRANTYVATLRRLCTEEIVGKLLAGSKTPVDREAGLRL